MKLFAFDVLCLRVKNVVIKHGLGNFFKEVFAHRITHVNGIAMICKAVTKVFHTHKYQYATK